MDLTEFLLARIAEDEAEAKPMLRHVYGEHNEGLFEFEDCWNGPILCVDPRRALSELEAKRRIVERHSQVETAILEDHGGQDEVTCCGHCGTDLDEGDCLDLLDLASVYSDHPDYDEYWRP